MFDKRGNGKKSKKKRKLNHINPFTPNKDTIQVLDFTKEPKYSNLSENANGHTRKTLSNFKLVKENKSRNVVNYSNMEDHRDCTNLKSRMKHAANPQLKKSELDSLTKFVYDPSHNVEQGQGDKFTKVIDSKSLDTVDSDIRHAPGKINIIDYSNDKVGQWNYNELEHASKEKANKAEFLVTESYEKNANTPENRLGQQTPIEPKTYKHGSENINKLEYAYFDKSESDEETEDDDKIKHKPIDKVDYVQVPMYEIEKTSGKKKSKLNTYISLTITVAVINIYCGTPDQFRDYQ